MKLAADTGSTSRTDSAPSHHNPPFAVPCGRLLLTLSFSPRGVPATSAPIGVRPRRRPSACVDRCHARSQPRRLESVRPYRNGFEQVLLLALLGVIFATILPGIAARRSRLPGVAAISSSPIAAIPRAARRGGFVSGRRPPSIPSSSYERGPCAIAQRCSPGRLRPGYGVFFAFRITTITAYDRSALSTTALRELATPRESIGDFSHRARERRPYPALVRLAQQAVSRWHDPSGNARAECAMNCSNAEWSSVVCSPPTRAAPRACPNMIGTATLGPGARAWHRASGRMPGPPAAPGPRRRSAASGGRELAPLMPSKTLCRGE